MKNYLYLPTCSGTVKRLVSLSARSKRIGPYLLMIGLLLSIALPSQAQLYYTLTDGAFATRNDEVRRIALDGTGDVQIATNYIDSPGVLAIDPANNRIFVAEVRATVPAIVRVDRTTGANSIFLSLPANNAPTGLAVDQVNGYLYYAISDGAFATTNDQLRRIKLDGTGDELIATGFAEVIGAIALDLPNNRVFVADTRITAGPAQVFAVNLTTKLATEFINNTLAIRSVAVDRVNSKLYYIVDDAAATTNNDQLRRVNLNGTGDELVATNFVNSPGPLAVDQVNNRVLVADVRANLPKIYAVDISTKTATLFFTPSIASRSLAGIAVFEQAPTVTTAGVTGVGSSSAIAGGNVTNAGSSLVTSRGVVYSSTNMTPVLGVGTSTSLTIGSGTGSFSQTIGGLMPTTTYYLRAYAINAAGTAYGAVQSFTTTVANTAPTVANVIPPQSATVNQSFSLSIPANTFSDAETPGSLSLTVSGLPGSFSFTAPATISGTASTTVGSPFSVTVTATDPGGLSVSTTFTLSIQSYAPTVTTTGVTGVGSSSAIAGGNVTNAGSSPVTSRGVVYSSTNMTPVLGVGTSTSLTIGSGTGSFSQTIGGLMPTTTYYLRAYAINAAGTAYGAVQSFTTTVANTAPTVANMIPPQSATVNQSFSLSIPANTFSDAETPGSLSLTVSGLPGSFSFTAPATISGTASTTVGSPFSVTVTATDPGGLSVSTTFTLSIELNAPMPVRLVRFDAQQLATGSVSLRWETSWEQNAAWFEVQRGDNAREFGVLDKIVATGESSQRQQYSFEDQQTPVQTVYYRLRVVDKDGSFAYSSIVAVSVDQSRLLLTVLGNPSQHTLRLLVNSPVAQPIELSLQTVNGQVINRREVRVTVGQTKLDMDVTNLAVGTYLLIVNDGESRYAKRVLIN